MRLPASVSVFPSSTHEPHHSTAARSPDAIGSPNRHSTWDSTAKFSARYGPTVVGGSNASDR